MDVNEWIYNECAECVFFTTTLICRWFAHSHPSKGENRTRNCSESCKCERDFTSMHGKYTNFYLISLLEPPPAEWSDWTWWTPCKKSCGGGHQLRYRSCDNPPPAPGAAECSGERNQTLECNVHPCPGMKFCGSYIFTSSM
jgi:hypothetical protein